MIYKASFINPIDGEHDTLDTTKIGFIDLLKNSIRTFDSEVREYYINYEFLNLEEKQKVILRAKNDSFNFTHDFDLDMQRFVDEASRAAQNKKLPDSTGYIQELKHKALSLLAAELLKINKLSLGASYPYFGFIYSGADKVATFESIIIDDRDEIILEDVVSIVSLDNVDNLSFETYFNNTKFTGKLSYTNIETTNKANYSHKFALSDFTKKEEENSNIPKVEPISTFNFNEDFISSRKSLLDINTNNDSFSLDEFSDLF